MSSDIEQLDAQLKEAIKIIMMKGVEMPEYMNFCTDLTAEIVQRFANKNEPQSENNNDTPSSSISGSTSKVETIKATGKVVTEGSGATDKKKPVEKTPQTSKSNVKIDQAVKKVPEPTKKSTIVVKKVPEVKAPQTSKSNVKTAETVKKVPESTKKSTVEDKGKVEINEDYLERLFDKLDATTYRDVKKKLIECISLIPERKVQCMTVRATAKAMVSKPSIAPLIAKMWKEIIDEDKRRNVGDVSKYKKWILSYFRMISLCVESSQPPELLKQCVFLGAHCFLQGILSENDLEPEIVKLIAASTLISVEAVVKFVEICGSKIRGQFALTLIVALEYFYDQPAFRSLKHRLPDLVKLLKSAPTEQPDVSMDTLYSAFANFSNLSHDNMAQKARMFVNKTMSIAEISRMIKTLVPTNIGSNPCKCANANLFVDFFLEIIRQLEAKGQKQSLFITKMDELMDSIFTEIIEFVREEIRNGEVDMITVYIANTITTMSSIFFANGSKLVSGKTIEKFLKFLFKECHGAICKRAVMADVISIRCGINMMIKCGGKGLDPTILDRYCTMAKNVRNILDVKTRNLLDDLLELKKNRFVEQKKPSLEEYKTIITNLDDHNMDESVEKLIPFWRDISVPEIVRKVIMDTPSQLLGGPLHYDLLTQLTKTLLSRLQCQMCEGAPRHPMAQFLERFYAGQLNGMIESQTRAIGKMSEGEIISIRIHIRWLASLFAQGLVDSNQVEKVLRKLFAKCGTGVKKVVQNDQPMIQCGMDFMSRCMKHLRKSLRDEYLAKIMIIRSLTTPKFQDGIDIFMVMSKVILREEPVTANDNIHRLLMKFTPEELSQMFFFNIMST